MVIGSIVGYDVLGRNKIKVEIQNSQPAIIHIADKAAQDKALGELDEVFNGIPAGYARLQDLKDSPPIFDDSIPVE